MVRHTVMGLAVRYVSTCVFLQQYSDVQVLPHQASEIFRSFVFGQNLLHVSGYDDFTWWGQLEETQTTMKPIILHNSNNQTTGSNQQYGCLRVCRLSYSVSGDRAGDNNRRTATTDVTIADKHLSVSHWSPVKIPEADRSHVFPESYALSMQAVVSSRWLFGHVHSPGGDLEGKVVKVSEADVVHSRFHKDGETWENCGRMRIRDGLVRYSGFGNVQYWSKFQNRTSKKKETQLYHVWSDT